MQCRSATNIANGKKMKGFCGIVLLVQNIIWHNISRYQLYYPFIRQYLAHTSLALRPLRLLPRCPIPAPYVSHEPPLCRWREEQNDNYPKHNKKVLIWFFFFTGESTCATLKCLKKQRAVCVFRERGFLLKGFHRPQLILIGLLFFVLSSIKLNM